MESVASLAGTSVPTFYTYFDSKEGALAAAFSAALDDLVALVQTSWTVEKLLEEGLSALCRSGVGASVAYFRTHALLFRVALAALPQSKELRQVYRDHERIVVATYEQFIRLGQRARCVRGTDADVPAMALTHLILTQGLNNPHLLTRAEPAILDRIAAALHANLALADDAATNR